MCNLKVTGRGMLILLFTPECVDHPDAIDFAAKTAVLSFTK